jgi:hypothetical protein
VVSHPSGKNKDAARMGHPSNCLGWGTRGTAWDGTPGRRGEPAFEVGGKIGMSVLDVLRKGFGYVLMSMGVSSPAPKKPAPKPAGKPDSGEKSGS